uniref:Uncharacterized protein n=1 Tax=Glossina palpalis gambiensis TaxID=67801 RepID=A0A1B0ALA1_9MUSC
MRRLIARAKAAEEDILLAKEKFRGFQDGEKVLKTSIVHNVLFELRRTIRNMECETLPKAYSIASSPGSTGRSTPSEMSMTPESRNETRASMLLHNFLKNSRRKAVEAASRRQSHGPKRARLTEEDDFVPVHDDFVPVYAESCDSPPMSAQSKFDQLSEKDKIVQIHFDEVYTNHATVYSRADDELRGCDHTNQKKNKNIRTSQCASLRST